eukprot:12507642-Ditylum_brightwellii.AAC.1
MGLLMIRTTKHRKMKHLKMTHPKNHHHQQHHHILFLKSTNNIKNIFASTTQLGDLLWFLCVGVTGSYAWKIGYTEFVFDLRKHTMRLNEGEEEERRENENVLGEGR